MLSEVQTLSACQSINNNLHSNNNCKLPEIITFIDDKPYLTLIDSGANKSCINPNVIKIDQSTITPDTTKVFAANGSSLHNLGKIDLKISFGKMSKFIEVLLVENLSYPVIIGMDHIESLSFEAQDDLVTLNSQKIQRVKSRQIGACSTYTIVNESLEESSS